MGGYTAEFVGWYKRHVETHDENPRSTLFTKLIMKRKEEGMIEVVLL
jgi:hypothetical protein